MVDISKQLKLLNAEEYKSKHKEMYENWNNHVENHQDIYDPPQGNGSWRNRLANLPDYVTKNTGIDTDWQDAVLRTGLSQNYMLSVRGGEMVLIFNFIQPCQ